MSIIHDALKKVQHTLDRNYGRNSKSAAHKASPVNILNETRTIRTPDARTDNPSPLPMKTFLWLGNTILICVGIILILTLKILDTEKTNGADRSPLVATRLQQRSQQMAGFQSQQTKSSAPSMAKAQTPKPAAAPKPVATAPKPAPAFTDELVLGGIMLMGDQHVALINDDVYALGDSVEGKEITQITLKEVTLRDKNGTLTILKTVNRR